MMTKMPHLSWSWPLRRSWSLGPGARGWFWPLGVLLDFEHVLVWWAEGEEPHPLLRASTHFQDLQVLLWGENVRYPGPDLILHQTLYLLRWCEGHSCSVCGALVGFLLLPIAVVLAILAFILSAILIVLFMPVFIVFILPILIVTKCRRGSDTETLRKTLEEPQCNDDVFSKVARPDLLVGVEDKGSLKLYLPVDR